MKLYGRDQLDEITWPDNVDGRYARDFLEPMLREGTTHFFENVDCELFVLVFNNKVLPVNLGTKKLTDSYVASPYCHYVAYAAEELYLINNPLLRLLLKSLLLTLGFLFKVCRFNEVVYVNNWFLSTNLYPPLSENEVDEICRFLKKSFPRRPLVLRSLNTFSNQRLIESCQRSGFKKIISRQLYIVEDPQHCRQHKDFHNDRKLLGKSTYRVGAAEVDDAEVIRELYDQLYIDKYSTLNPHLSINFLRQARRQNLLEILTLRDAQDKIQACLGYFQRNGIMTTPLFGFNLAKPQKDALYRLLSLLLVYESEKHQLILNCSSGAADFKRHRGGRPFLEYNLVNYQGCSLRKIPWLVLRFFVTPVGSFLLRKFKL